MYDEYKQVIVVVTIATMFFGNVMALRQRKLKRILAYSGISHTGFMLMTLLNVENSQNNLLFSIKNDSKYFVNKNHQRIFAYEKRKFFHS
jgi:NADH:ubiquinone oxidoreductase subunit 2 (subunit N)